MITAVDTNVLLDVFLADVKFGQVSGQCLREALQLGVVVACDTVWAETMAVFHDQRDCDNALRELGIRFSPMNQQAAAKAGVIWKKYRSGGGKRARMVADFLIGAHASVQCDRLLTRDRGFYGRFFNDLQVIDPSVSLTRNSRHR